MTIEEIEKYVIGRKNIFPNSKECKMFEFLLSRINELEEGIEKHRWTSRLKTTMFQRDEKLYKLIEKDER